MKASEFYNYIAVDDAGCWNWTRARRHARGGYGVVSLFGKQVLAHRASYEMSKGPIPAGKFVCHSCDNPACVNPAHLWIGTHRQNMADATRKNRRKSPPRFYGDDHYMRRHPENCPKGEANPFSKLTEEKVTAIRTAYIGGISLADLSANFSVTPASIKDIVYGKSWTHLFGVNGSPSLASLQAARRPRPGAKITEETVKEIRRRLAAGELGKEIAESYGIHKATVSDIKRGKVWRHV